MINARNPLKNDSDWDKERILRFVKNWRKMSIRCTQKTNSLA